MPSGETLTPLRPSLGSKLRNGSLSFSCRALNCSRTVAASGAGAKRSELSTSTAPVLARSISAAPKRDSRSMTAYIRSKMRLACALGDSPARAGFASQSSLLQRDQAPIAPRSLFPYASRTVSSLTSSRHSSGLVGMGRSPRRTRMMRCSSGMRNVPESAGVTLGRLTVASRPRSNSSTWRSSGGPP